MATDTAQAVFAEMKHLCEMQNSPEMVRQWRSDRYD